MRNLLTAFFLLSGGAFMLLAALGVFRMPDLLTRMQAATKAATLGVSCMLVAVAVHFWELGVTTRALLVVCSMFLTAPVAAHMLAKSAYSLGVPLWPGTREERSPRRAGGPGPSEGGGWEGDGEEGRAAAPPE